MASNQFLALPSKKAEDSFGQNIHNNSSASLDTRDCDKGEENVKKLSAIEIKLRGTLAPPPPRSRRTQKAL